MKFIHFDEMKSTNEYLRKKLRVPEFEVVIAKKKITDSEEKEGMRISHEGAALFSFAVENRNELEEKITIFSSYIVFEILKNYIEDSNRNKLQIKWPGALYYENKEICKILCEKIRERIIVGIEINVNIDMDSANPDNLHPERKMCISLMEINGKKNDIEQIIEEIMNLYGKKFKNLNKQWEETLSIINDNNYLRDRKIKIERNGKYLEKEYRVLRVDRKGKISIIGKGDKEELKFSTLKYKIVQ